MFLSPNACSMGISIHAPRGGSDSGTDTFKDALECSAGDVFSDVIDYSYECGISDSFWLASRAIDLDYACYYIVRGSDSDVISGWELFASYGPENQISLPVVPAVTLKANIKTSGRDENGAWNLVFE